jgi:hypothetical protein
MIYSQRPTNTANVPAFSAMSGRFNWPNGVPSKGAQALGFSKHRDNLNTLLPVHDQQEGQVVDAGFN